MSHRAGADATLGADEGNDAAKRRGLRILVQIGDRLDHLHLVQRRHEIFADALPDEFAVEDHIIQVADDDDLGVGLADLGQFAKLSQDHIARAMRLDQQHVGRGLRLEHLDGRHDAAELDGRVSSCHAAVAGCHLHRLGSLLVVAEGMDVDAGHQGDKTSGHHRRSRHSPARFGLSLCPS